MRPTNKTTRVTAIWLCRSDLGDRREICHAYLSTLEGLGFDTQFVVVLIAPNPSLDKSDLTAVLRGSSVSSRILYLHRDCENSAAIRAAIDATEGDLVLLLPPYPQSDLAGIRGMFEALDRGWDYAASWRHPRVDSRWNALATRGLNALTRFLTGVPLHDINSGLRLMRRVVTEHVPIYGDLDRFLPIMASVSGFRVTEVRMRHLGERAKPGAYGLSVCLRRVLDLLTAYFLYKFAKKPLRFFGLIGSASAAAGLLIACVMVAQRLFGVALGDRPALLGAVVLFVLGVQLVSLGLLGELIIFTHASQRQSSHVEEIIKQCGGDNGRGDKELWRPGKTAPAHLSRTRPLDARLRCDDPRGRPDAPPENE